MNNVVRLVVILGLVLAFGISFFSIWLLKWFLDLTFELKPGWIFFMVLYWSVFSASGIYTAKTSKTTYDLALEVSGFLGYASAFYYLFGLQQLSNFLIFALLIFSLILTGPAIVKKIAHKIGRIPFRKTETPK